MFASMLSDEANFFWERNFHDDGINAASLAVSILDRLNQPDPNEQATARCIWGCIEFEKGIRGRGTGLRLLVETLDIRKRFIESPPPGGTSLQQLLYANAWNDFGCGLLEFAEYAEAEKYLEHSLEIKKLNTNEQDEPMMFAECYMNLAMVRSFQGRHKEAKGLLESSANLAETANGQHSACAQNFNFYWATILFNAGDLEFAKEKHEAILQERIDIFGVFSPCTRRSYYALAMTCQKLELLEESE